MESEKQRRLIVFGGVTTSGKTLTKEELAYRFSGVKVVITSTTRQPRPKERHGIDYYFYDRTEFMEKFNNDELVEKDNFAKRGKPIWH